MLPMHISSNIKAPLPGIYIFLILVIFNSCREETFSPSQADSFIKFFGNYYKDEGFDILSLNDGGFLLTGTTTTEDSGTNIVLIRTDKYGNELWLPRQFGGSYDDRAYSLAELSDGSFAILGSTTVEAHNGALVSNMYLIKTDSRGDTLWTRKYGGYSNETGLNIAETSDGGFILIGSTESLNSGDKDIYIVKTDSEGFVQWTRVHGGPSDDVGTYIAETDYGYIYTGYTRSYSQSGQANSNIFIVKTNHLGRVTFPYTYGSTGDDYGKALVPISEGGYLILGTTTDPATGIKNVFLARVEENISNPLWIEQYGGQTDHVASCIKVTNNGDFVITGTQEISSVNHVIFLLKTDNNGNQLFLRTFGGSGHQRAEALDLTIDGGYVITGSNELAGNSMITLIKTTSDGEL
jgi:hypothetical protein